MNEAWKDIKGYEGFYQISDLGNIRRLESFVKVRNRWGKEMLVRRRGRLHNFHVNYRGYARVELSKNGIQKIFSVHRLVAESFVENPSNLPIVCHRDDNPLNNSASNLFWGTQKDNMIDKCKKQRQAKGAASGNVSLDEDAVREIRRIYDRKTANTVFFANKYGVTPACISLIINNRTWKHIQ